MTGQRTARQIVLCCAAASITAEDRDRLSQLVAETVDWEYLIRLAAFHGIIPLVFYNLVVNGFSTQVPQRYLVQLKCTYDRVVFRNLILSDELANILATFSKHGIGTICLKGAALAEVLYENPCLRIAGDMDILLQARDIPMAGGLLAELGYKEVIPKTAKEHPFHGKPYCKGASFPLLVELHRGLDDSRLAAIPEEEIWQRSQPFQLHGVSTLILSPEDNLLFLCNHFFKHTFHVLKFLVDLSELLKKYKASLDWGYITVAARSWEIEPAVYFALRQAEELAGTTIPASALESVRPSDRRRWLVDLLISRESLISPIWDNRLRSHTAAFVRSLMMKHPREMLYVLSRQYGPGERVVWLRTVFWIMPVTVAALLRRRVRDDVR